ncbi:MAG: hypothetical protein J2P49_00815 [Methylocapsa sp.]|nr:hypothetical protein [Methylocapsa sp.]
MTFLKIAVAVTALCLGLLLPGTPQARPVGTVNWMPFFAQPYPFGFDYRPPPMQCYDIQEVQTPAGPMIQQIWTCDGGGEARVRARY